MCIYTKREFMLPSTDWIYVLREIILNCKKFRENNSMSILR